MKRSVNLGCFLKNSAEYDIISWGGLVDVYQINYQMTVGVHVVDFVFLNWQ